MNKSSRIIIGSILFCLFCIWIYSATGRVKNKHILTGECEEVALDLLIESIENSRWIHRRFYEVHVWGKPCNVVINYYPKKDVLSISTDPCSGFGGQFWISIHELTELKNQHLTFDDLSKKLRRPPQNHARDIPNSLCDLFIIF